MPESPIRSEELILLSHVILCSSGPCRHFSCAETIPLHHPLWCPPTQMASACSTVWASSEPVTLAGMLGGATGVSLHVPVCSRDHWSRIRRAFPEAGCTLPQADRVSPKTLQCRQGLQLEVVSSRETSGFGRRMEPQGGTVRMCPP